MGRPTKRTPQVEADLVAALRAGNTRRAACDYAGITQETFSQWQRRFPEFSEAIKKAESEAEVRMVAHVLKAATDGTWQAAAWWLERRRAGDYGRRVEMTIRQQAEKLAAEMGLDASELILEAERIGAGR